MTQEHPITPPPELVQKWLGEFFGCNVTGELSDSERYLATQAARWGSDQELDAYRSSHTGQGCLAAALRAAALEVYSEEYETCGGASYSLMIDVDDLLAIADELDGTQPTSESD